MAKINTVISLTDNVSQPLRNIENQMGKTTSAFSSFASKIFSVNQAVQLFQAVGNGISFVTGKITEMTDAYDIQAQAELKLETVMRNHMGATKEQIQMIKDFASAEQQAGVFGDEMILAGAQELATYIDDVDTLKGLIPVMNSMVAQGVGAQASASDMQSYATMLGKVMQGQVGGMSKRGYKFTDAEEEILKTGTELQKLEVLQQNVLGNFGDMNRALSGNLAGQIQQINNEMGDLKEVIGGILKPLQLELKLFSAVITRDFYASLKNTLEKIIPIITRMVRAFQNIYIQVRPYLQKLHDFITNVIGKAIHWIIDNLQGIVSAVAILTTVVIAKTAIMAGAWAVMNWQIILAVGIIFAVIKALNNMGVKVKDIGRVVGAIFGGAFVVVYNIVADIYNLFISIADLIANITKHPLQALANFLADIFASFYDGLSTIAGLIDGIGAFLGKDWNLQGVLNGVANQIRSTKFTEDMVISERMTKKNKEDFVNSVLKGSEYGAELGGKIDNGVGLIKEAINGVSDDKQVEEALNKSFNFNGDGTLAVTDKNMVNIADDYRELLTRRATEKFNLQFSQITPEVNVGGITVNNNADLDSVIDAIATGVEEAQATSLSS